MPLNLIQKKSWNVWSKDAKGRVARDEEQTRESNQQAARLESDQKREKRLEALGVPVSLAEDDNEVNYKGNNPRDDIEGTSGSGYGDDYGSHDAGSKSKSEAKAKTKTKPKTSDFDTTTPWYMSANFAWRDVHSSATFPRKQKQTEAAREAKQAKLDKLDPLNQIHQKVRETKMALSTNGSYQDLTDNDSFSSSFSSSFASPRISRKHQRRRHSSSRPSTVAAVSSGPPGNGQQSEIQALVHSINQSAPVPTHTTNAMRKVEGNSGDEYAAPRKQKRKTKRKRREKKSGKSDSRDSSDSSGSSDSSDSSASIDESEDGVDYRKRARKARHLRDETGKKRHRKSSDKRKGRLKKASTSKHEESMKKRRHRHRHRHGHRHRSEDG